MSLLIVYCFHIVVKLKRVIGKIFSTLWWTAITLLLLVVGCVLVFYSPWFQDYARQELVSSINTKQQIKVSLNRLSIKFPLTASFEGLSVITPQNDTLIAAEKIYADVAPLSVFDGEIYADSIFLRDAQYLMNDEASTQCMKITATKLDLSQSTVSLDFSEINLTKADIEGGDVDLSIKEDTTTEKRPTDSTTANPLIIKATEINLKNFSYRMSLEGTIDTLNALFADAHINDAIIDMSRHSVNVNSLKGTGLNAAYWATTTSNKNKQSDNTASSSNPWTIGFGSIDLSSSKALYATSGIKPSIGMDLRYIAIDSLDLEVTNFYNKASDISIPITSLRAKERSGITMRGSGEFAMQSGEMLFKNFDLATTHSQLNIDGRLTDISSLSMTLQGKGAIALSDIITIFPDSRSILKGVSQHEKVTFDLNVASNNNQLDINKLYAAVGHQLKLTAKGHLNQFNDLKKTRGNLNISGNIADAKIINSYLKKNLGQQFNIVAMALNGEVNFVPGQIKGDIKVKSKSGGTLAMKGNWNQNSLSYDIDLTMNKFPVNAFLPQYGVGQVTGTVVADGRKFDPFDPNMRTAGEVVVESIVYGGVNYNNVFAKVDKRGSIVEAEITSSDKRADFDVVACCTFDKTTIDWDLNADVRHFDLGAFNIDTENSVATAQILSSGYADAKNRLLTGNLRLEGAEYHGGLMDLVLNEVDFNAVATDSTTSVSLRNEDLLAIASTSETLNDTFAMKFANAAFETMQQIDNRQIEVELIQQSLPQFNINMRAGSNNALARYLSGIGYDFDKFQCTLSNDSAISLSANLLNFRQGTTAIDTLTLNANQYDKILMYNASMGNRKGTMDAFANVNLEGYLANDLISAHLTQRNISGNEGYNIGAVAHVGEELVRMEFFPETPIIGYKQWTINDDNFIEYNMTNNHVDANVSMTNATSEVNIYTEHTDSSSHQEDVIIKIKDLKLSEWLAINPYSPPVKGDVSANMRINWGGGKLNGDGVVSLNELFYGRERVGSFVADVELLTSKDGRLRADAALTVDGVKTVTVAGVLNSKESTAPMMLDFSMIKFPLKVVNPILPPNMGTLSGSLNGLMKISGEKSSPVFDGVVNFDSAMVVVDMLGTPLRISEDTLNVTNNIVDIKDFAIIGANNNPLNVNGQVDISDLASPAMDLILKARNMQIVGSNKSKKADVYGKGFVDIDADVVGNMSHMDIDATIELLSGSNITYIMPDATSSLTSYNVDDMVTFVDFSDTTQVNEYKLLADEMAMEIDVAMIVAQGTTINIDLSTDGKNRVQLQGNGAFNYSLNPMDDGRFTGRYTIDKGFVRYTPPLMSEKLFNFNEGSYVAFTGDMMNPTLNLSAIDDIKANVSQEGQDSRLINFDVEVSVTNTLNNMNVAFDLSTPDDITIANELSSMSSEQRANQAMNMLLYNVYTGPGTTASTNFSGNPLYAFVESKVNTWVANNVKFVDISFGIDQYDKTQDGNTSTTTSYSYKVSKTLFDDRFKIVVGGNYSTDAEVDENYSQNLINDISFEYILNRSGSMYVKLFRQVGYESILEGEVIQTGVGFVYKRKLKSLRDIFKK